MQGEPLRTKVIITNPQGFHMRPQSAFAQLASKYQSEVYLYNEDNQPFNGKSHFELLGLLAGQGAELTLEVRGPDQEEAFKTLRDLMMNLSSFDAETGDIAGE